MTEFMVGAAGVIVVKAQTLEPSPNMPPVRLPTSSLLNPEDQSRVGGQQPRMFGVRKKQVTRPQPSVLS